MHYSSSLSKFLDEIFSYENRDIFGHAYVYDYVKNDNIKTEIEVVVPGYSKEELKLEVFDDILKLSCDIKDKKFVRKWRLDHSVQLDDIKAESKNGILTITLVKKKQNKTKHIIIE